MDALPQLPAQPMLVLGLALVASSLLGALVLLVRRRRRAAPAAVPVVPAEPTVSEVDAEPDAEPDIEPDIEVDAEGEPSSVTLRALRAQVRVLEETLASAAAPQDDRDPDLEVDRYRRQVRCAVQAVAQDADDRTRHVVARVAAAIDRLDAPAGFARPVLPVDRVEQVDPTAPSEDTERRVGLVAVAPLVEPVAPQPEIEPLVVPARDAVPVPEAELVLPVPPPAPAATRRSRRRLRHPAA